MTCKYFVQCVATFGVFLMMVLIGIQYGWSSPNLARLTSNDSEIHLTPEEASWVVASPGLGGLIGSLLGSVVVDSIGAKKTILLASVLTSATWMCMIVANSAVWLFFVRTVGGLANSITLCSFPLYLGEISAPSIRGTLVSLVASGTALGTVIGTIAESYLPTVTSSSIYLIQCFVALLIFAWLSDSPHYLVKVQDLDGAKKSISFYNPTCKIDEELKIITELVESDLNQNFVDRMREIKTPRIRRLTILIFLLFSLYPLSGILMIKSYMELILSTAKFSLISPKDFVIHASVVEVVTNFLTIRLIDKFGRRLLLVISSVGSGIAMVGLGLHFYLLSLSFDVEKIQWLPSFSIIFFLVMNGIGYSRVPSTVLGEIFPQYIKSFGTCVANVSLFSISFFTVKAYQPLTDVFGEAYVFWFFALFPFLITLGVLFVLPETKGKSLHEIQKNLSKS